MATAVDPNLLFFVTLDILLNKQSKNQLNTSIHSLAYIILDEVCIILTSTQLFDG